MTSCGWIPSVSAGFGSCAVSSWGSGIRRSVKRNSGEGRNAVLVPSSRKRISLGTHSLRLTEQSSDCRDIVGLVRKLPQAEAAQTGDLRKRESMQ